MKPNKLSAAAAALLLSSCSMDYEQYASFDAYYPSAFVTIDEAILESSALKDTCLFVTDSQMSVQGGFEHASSDIIGYGHCWVKGNFDPTINKDSTNCKIHGNFINSGDTFKTLIEGLEHETSYSVRSFVITRDGNVGYNPQITKVTTSTPHDKWYDEGFLMAGDNTVSKRADGISITAIIDGDTLTYFGLGRDGSRCFSDFYCYSASKKEFKQVQSLPQALWGAAGFFHEQSDRNGNKIKRIYVCTGCKKAQQFGLDDYSTKAYVYDPQKNAWDQVTTTYDDGSMSLNTSAFSGAPRTGATAFTLHGYGFVGLGHFINQNAMVLTDDFLTFYMYIDPNGNGVPNKGRFKIMGQAFPYAPRTGASVAVLNDMAFITGGMGKDGQAYDDLLRCTFSPPMQGEPDDYMFSWASLSYKFPEGYKPRAYGAAFALGSAVYFGGGEEPDGTLHSDFVKYELSNNTISWCAPYKNGDPAEQYKDFSRAFVIQGSDRAFVGGGYVAGEAKFANTKWVYRP